VNNASEAREGRLGALYDPASVTVVGASDSPAKWGYWLAKGALAGVTRRRVYLVNRRRTPVLGQPTFGSLADLPEPTDLVVVAVPGSEAPSVVTEAVAARARALVVIPDVGREAESKIRAALETSTARLLGPNCMGIVDHGAGLQLIWGSLPPGRVGLVSQSGNLGLEIGRHLARAGAGVSRFVSLGNQWDIDAADVINDLVDDPTTSVIACYLESLGEEGRLAGALCRARAARKPVVLLSVGISEASARAARSHTGALVTPRRALEALCEATGAVRAASAGHLVDTACVLMASGAPAPSAPAPSAPAPSAPAPGVLDAGALDAAEPQACRRHRVAVVGDSGGQGALAADAFVEEGLEVPELQGTTCARLREVAGVAGAAGNPVDLAGAGEADLENYARVVDVLLGSHEVDSVVLTGYFGDYASDDPTRSEHEAEVAHRIAALVTQHGLPVVVHSMARGTPALDVLRHGGVPVFERIDEAAAALSVAARWWGPARAWCTASKPPRAVRRAIPRLAHGPSDLPGSPAPRQLDYVAARALITSYGVQFPSFVVVPCGGDRDEVRDEDLATCCARSLEAALKIGFPVVIKAMGTTHKSEAGAVALDVPDATALGAVVDRMLRRLRPSALSVEELVHDPAGKELLVGVRRDPQLGLITVLGAGGVTAELANDHVMALSPVRPDEVRGFLGRLRLAPLFEGFRGSPALDVTALAPIITALERAMSDNPSLVEIEVNPVLVRPVGAVALDARAVIAP
jgi:acyl-CoA synthetase (NDP forming)